MDGATTIDRLGSGARTWQNGVDILPIAVAVIGTVSGAAIAASWLKLDWLYLIPRYVVAASGVTLFMVLVALYIQFAQLALIKHPDPYREVRARWISTKVATRLALPIIVAPTFLTGFVVLKAAATETIPYTWDRLLTELDFWIFGVDPWIPLHGWLNYGAVPALMEKAYVGWQLILPASLVGAAIWMKRGRLVHFYTAMFWTWIIGGVFFAAWTHSAGPIFVYLFDPDLGERFAGLGPSLQAALPEESRIVNVHRMLAENVGNSRVSPGGGISAMPSMHLAVTAIYVHAAWRHPFVRVVTLTFAAVIWVGSVYFGYHYWTDGPVAFLIAWLCWVVSGNLLVRLNSWKRPTVSATE